jgi:hypothetical protein
MQVRQLVFYRGYGECKASRWVSAAADLYTLMRTVSRGGGGTPIECAFNHGPTETEKAKVERWSLSAIR